MACMAHARGWTRAEAGAGKGNAGEEAKAKPGQLEGVCVLFCLDILPS